MIRNPFHKRETRVPPIRQAINRDSIYILRFLQTNRAQPAVDREIEAITDWLFTPPKKNGPVAPGPFQSPKKGN